MVVVGLIDFASMVAFAAVSRTSGLAMAGGDAGFILALVGLSGALAPAWAGLWLVIGSNIRI